MTRWNQQALQQAQISAPWQHLGNYSNLIQGQYGGTSSTSQPYYTNPLTGALGGAIGGAALGGMVAGASQGAIGGPWGWVLAPLPAVCSVYCIDFGRCAQCLANRTARFPYSGNQLFNRADAVDPAAYARMTGGV